MQSKHATSVLRVVGLQLMHCRSRTACQTVLGLARNLYLVSNLYLSTSLPLAMRCVRAESPKVGAAGKPCSFVSTHSGNACHAYRKPTNGAIPAAGAVTGVRVTVAPSIVPRAVSCELTAVVVRADRRGERKCRVLVLVPWLHTRVRA